MPPEETTTVDPKANGKAAAQKIGELERALKAAQETAAADLGKAGARIAELEGTLTAREATISDLEARVRELEDASVAREEYAGALLEVPGQRLDSRGPRPEVIHEEGPLRAKHNLAIMVEGHRFELAPGDRFHAPREAMEGLTHGEHFETVRE